MEQTDSEIYEEFDAGRKKYEASLADEKEMEEMEELENKLKKRLKS